MNKKPVRPTCEAIRDRLTLYLLGDLDPRTQETIARHLAECDACRTAADRLAPTLGLLRDALQEDMPDAPVALSPEHRQRVIAAFRQRAEATAQGPDESSPLTFMGRRANVGEMNVGRAPLPVNPSKGPLVAGRRMLGGRARVPRPTQPAKDKSSVKRKPLLLRFHILEMAATLIAGLMIFSIVTANFGSHKSARSMTVPVEMTVQTSAIADYEPMEELEEIAVPAPMEGREISVIGGAVTHRSGGSPAREDARLADASVRVDSIMEGSRHGEPLAFGEVLVMEGERPREPLAQGNAQGRLSNAKSDSSERVARASDESRPGWVSDQWVSDQKQDSGVLVAGVPMDQDFSGTPLPPPPQKAGKMGREGGGSNPATEDLAKGRRMYRKDGDDNGTAGQPGALVAKTVSGDEMALAGKGFSGEAYYRAGAATPATPAPEPPEPTEVQMDISADMPSLPTETVVPPSDGFTSFFAQAPAKKVDGFQEMGVNAHSPEFSDELNVPVDSLESSKPSPPQEMASVQSANFDSVAIVKSPVVLPGMAGSRSSGARGTTRREAFSDDRDVPIEIMNKSEVEQTPVPSSEATMHELDSRQRMDAPPASGPVGKIEVAKEMPILGDIPVTGRLMAKDLALSDVGGDRQEAAKSGEKKRKTETDGNRRDAIAIDGAVAGDLFKVPQSERVLEKSVSEVLGDEELPDAFAPRFKAAGVNPLVAAVVQPFSTFSIDVDTASYTVSRNYMLGGNLPPPEAVRTEEFVNFFDYAYDPPVGKTFRVAAEIAPSRFGRGLHLLKLGVKGRRLGREEQRQASLTLLVDSSGSMNQPDRLGLMRTALELLLAELADTDQVAIIQFDNRARLVLAHTPVAQRETILRALGQIQCGGGTNLEAGLGQAYEQAAKAFISRGENRILLMSDGVVNLGETASDAIAKRIEANRRQGLYLSVFGFGMGIYDDAMLKELASKGNGAYAFIDSEDEARRVFVDDLSSTLNTIAEDVKIQIEFNPKRVNQYRQLGYEQRQLTKEQFRDDTVDAGEVGSGQSVTALYELSLADLAVAYPAQAQQMLPREADDDWLAVARVRYRRVDNGKIEEIEQRITARDILPAFDAASPRFRLAAGAAAFAEILRGSPFVQGVAFEDVAAVLRPVALDLHLDARIRELVQMVETAGGLAR